MSGRGVLPLLRARLGSSWGLSGRTRIARGYGIDGRHVATVDFGCNHVIPASHKPPRLHRARPQDFMRDGSLPRPFFTEALHVVPTVLIPPVVFTGLLITLWTYKCLMMVLFQDKIIYMPYMPPFARSEKVEDYAGACRPVVWEEARIRSLDGTKLGLCVGRLPYDQSGGKAGREVAICYFQGNGGSLPPRLPLLSSVLKAVNAHRTSSKIDDKVSYTLYALSYRGYWTSSGRATQSGIEKDAQALLQHLEQNLSDGGLDIILWGQSIGAGVANTAAATYLKCNASNNNSTGNRGSVKIKALVLETPFLSTKNMLLALYPQKWLPYRYLSLFLWNRWDSEAALKSLAASTSETPTVLLVPATKDELVPAEEADEFERLCRELGFEIERKDVEGALHNETTLRREGQQAIARFMASV